MELPVIKILLINKDEQHTEQLKQLLSGEGYYISVALNALLGLKLAQSIRPDLILMDIVLDTLDGVEVCRILRDNSFAKKTLIAFLTERKEDYVQIAGLGAGADDFIVKPISQSVLLFRIKALLRQKIKQIKYLQSTRLEVGNLQINKESYISVINGNKINLPKKEFDILWLLVSRNEKVFSYAEIKDKIWGKGASIDTPTIDVYMSKLRGKIGKDLIKRIKGVGYTFQEGTVQERSVAGS